MLVVVADALDQVAENMNLFVVQSAGRLVEQQDLRLGGERAGELDALLRAERQAGYELVLHRLQIEVVDDLATRSFSARSCLRVHGRCSASLTMSPLVWECAPTRMLSTTDMFGNSATFWNVRPMPTSQILCAGLVEDALRRSTRMSPLLGW